MIAHCDYSRYEFTELGETFCQHNLSVAGPKKKMVADATVLRETRLILAGSSSIMVDMLVCRALDRNLSDWPRKEEHRQEYYSTQMNTLCCGKEGEYFHRVKAEYRKTVTDMIVEHESWIRCQPEKYGCWERARCAMLPLNSWLYGYDENMPKRTTSAT